LSFEFTTIQKGVGLACIDRCVELGFARFNAVLGESREYVFEHETDAAGVRAWLAELPPEANSGDIYAT
jgi:hypothetical protein